MAGGGKAGVLHALAGSGAELLEGLGVSGWTRARACVFRCAAESGHPAEAARSLFTVEVPQEVAARYLLSTDEPFFVPEESTDEAGAQLGFGVDPGPTLVAPVTWDPHGLAVILLPGSSGSRFHCRHF